MSDLTLDDFKSFWFDAMAEQNIDPMDAFERNRGALMIYAPCTCDEYPDGEHWALMQVLVLNNSLQWRIATIALRNQFHEDQLVVMITSHHEHYDNVDDADKPDVMPDGITVGWMLWHVTLTGVECHHLTTDGVMDRVESRDDTARQLDKAIGSFIAGGTP